VFFFLYKKNLLFFFISVLYLSFILVCYFKFELEVLFYLTYCEILKVKKMLSSIWFILDFTKSKGRVIALKIQEPNLIPGRKKKSQA